MNIKEAEKLTGISKRNIRFYEQKGMLHPARNQDN
ncbi:MerR family transcriptional regulator, partial [Pseudoflavonifractor capillosus]